MDAKKPILITGSHHSGTTWVGKMIAASSDIAYIHEPFNPMHSLGMCSAKFEQWFYYITNENAESYYLPFKDTLEFRYNLLAKLQDVKFSKGLKAVLVNAKQAFNEYQTFQQYRSLEKRPLIKDPIAIFSAEWLAKTFDADVIVLVRHPAAFISSLKRLNEKHPFSHFLQQPLLMRDRLYLFEKEIQELSSKDHDIIDCGILLWKIVHSVIAKYEAQNENWLFFRHEDISREPTVYFEKIFLKLGLDFNNSVKEYIENYSGSSNPNQAPEKLMSIKLDSKANIWNWKKRLSQTEISYIRNKLEDFPNKFYSDSDW